MKLPIFLTLLWLVLLASCTNRSTSEAPRFLKDRVGQDCVVQFRRDALGAAANLPIAPNSGSINGADVAFRGKLLAVEARGIAIDARYLTSEPKTLWIPHSAILSVGFDTAK